MIGRLHAIVLDCAAPQSLAEFYRGVLGGRIEADGDDWVDLIADSGAPHLSFQLSPGHVAPRWPSDDGDQQIHLDVRVEDFEAAEAELLRLGARFVEAHQGFRVYLDPAGHPFCTVG